jgi:hypothetical protein
MSKKNVGRPCSICNHDKLQIINPLLGKKSFRAISRQIQGNDSIRDALRRHAHNCFRRELSEQMQLGQNTNIPQTEKPFSAEPSVFGKDWWNVGEAKNEKDWWEI